jgi:GNAT superfamily N-acetyltransferase
MSAAVTIRAATVADTALVLAFVHKKSEFDRATGSFSGHLGTSEARIRATLFGERPFAHALLAELDGAVAGFALYYFRYSSFAGRPSLWLDDLYVDEAARSRGAGAALMARLVQIAVEHESTHLGWTASVNNPRGVAFYERLGAKVIDRAAPELTLRLDVPRVDGEVRARLGGFDWVVFDWGDTLMSEAGPDDRPMALWPEVRAIDGAFALLATLSARRRIAVATNAQVSDAAMIWRALERVALRPFVSELFCYRELGVRKRDPAFWDAVVARLGVARDRMVMIGDSLDEDVLAPRRYGIASVWLNWKGAPVPPGSDLTVIDALPQLLRLV